MLFRRLLVASVVMAASSMSAQQPKGAPHGSATQSKQTLEAKPISALDTAIAALTSAKTFAQVAISPDAKNIAWVEAIPGKNGVETGGNYSYTYDESVDTAILHSFVRLKPETRLV